jgi:tetratricopeptide (TPR) repeat protein
MSHSTTTRRALTGLVGILGLWAAACSAPEPPAAPPDKMPITTSSDEARKLFLEGRDLMEKLRGTDAVALFERALAADPDFALAYVGLAISSNTTKDFIDATQRATALADKVTEGERHLILGLDAGMKNDPASQEQHYQALVRLFPNDERAHNLLGNVYFGRQDYATAIQHYERATAINPSFSSPYNQLGYAHRFLKHYDEAEQAFTKYIELIPSDPNPYDSYAELLMKTGRFEDSIKNYEKALSVDPHFVASYVGIGNNHLIMGHPAEARATLAKLAQAARNTGERRLAHLWIAASHVREGAPDKAVAELEQASALAQAENDWASVSQDLIQTGDILREAGRIDAATAKYKESIDAIEKAQVPEEVKENTRRNAIFEDGRLAVARNDLATAKAKLAEYTSRVDVKKVPFEVRQQHELAGIIALAEKQYAAAADHLTQANQQDPRVLYLNALALEGAGQRDQAAAMASEAANFNGLAFNWVFVADKAKKLTSS